MYGSVALEAPLIDNAKPGTRTIKLVALATPLYVFFYLTLHLAGFACAAAKWASMSAETDPSGWRSRSWVLVFTPFWLADSMALVVCSSVAVLLFWNPIHAAERAAVLRMLSRAFFLAALGSLLLAAFHTILCEHLVSPSAVSRVWCFVPILALVLEILFAVGMCGHRPRPLATVCFAVLFAALLLLSYTVQEPFLPASRLWSSVVIAFVFFVMLLFCCLFMLASKHLKKQLHLSYAQACSTSLYAATLIMALPALISCASLNGVPAVNQHGDFVSTASLFLVGLACAELGMMITLTHYAAKVRANEGILQSDVKVPLVQTAAGWVPETVVTQNWLLVGDVTVINLPPQHALQQRKIRSRCCQSFFPKLISGLCKCWTFGEVEEEVADPESELRRTVAPGPASNRASGTAAARAVLTAGGSLQGRERADSGTYTDLNDFDDL
jgi:hypothetical protein